MNRPYILREALKRDDLGDIENENFKSSFREYQDHHINWEHSSYYVDENGRTMRVIHSGIKLIDRNSAQTSSVVPKNATIEDVLIPSEKIYYSSGEYSGGWHEGRLFPGYSSQEEANNSPVLGKIVRVIFPIIIEDVQNEYVFEFSVDSVVVNNKNNEEGIKFNEDVKMSDIINDLPFKLTKAQLRVLEEIDKDMESEKAMNRLLQGDVGSGKTIVAIIAAYKAVKSGYQMAIMAPTSILATQHLESFEEVLFKYNIKCELLLGSTSKKKKEDILERLKKRRDKCNNWNTFFVRRKCSI